MPPDNFLTSLQAAQLLGKGIRLIANLCKTGRLPGAEKIGNAWLIPRESALNYVPMKRGVKPGTQTKQQRLAAEKAAILAEAKGAKEE
jgi:hypothetical protein